MSIAVLLTPVPEIIDPVFAKTSQNARFLLSENERFGLVFVKTGSINSGTVINIHSRISPRIFEKNWIRPNGILGGPGTMIHEKKPKVESLVSDSLYKQHMVIQIRKDAFSVLWIAYGVWIRIRDKNCPSLEKKKSKKL